MTTEQTDRSAARPGVMGDGSEEQNLGQSGNPEARITESEVKAAFETEHTPASREVEPLAPDETPDQLAPKLEEAEDRQEALIDEGIEESFPASDPLSPKHIT